MTEENRELQVRETEKRELEESGVERTRDMPTFVPRADIYETDEEIVLIADMPGVDERSVDITLENDILTIYGHIEPMHPEDYSLTYAEYRVGDYQRSFALSDQIDRAKIEATVKDGVLHLHLPKVVEARTKKIAVKTG